MTQLPPAGWYPDPAGQVSLRYWDGRGWNEGPPPPPPQELRDTARTTSCVLIAVGLAGVFGVWSLFAGMVPADSCTPETCSDALIGAAYWLIWLGLPAAIGIGLTWIARAGKRRQPKAPAAYLTLTVTVALIVTWFVLMRLGTPSSMW